MPLCGQNTTEILKQESLRAMNMFIDYRFVDFVNLTDSLQMDYGSVFAVGFQTYKAWSLFYLGKYREAIRTADIADSYRETPLFDTILIKAKCFYRLGDIQQEEKYFKRVIEADIYDFLNLTLRSNFLILHDNKKLAHSDIDALLKQQTAVSYTTYYILGYLQIQEREYSVALATLHHADSLRSEAENADLSGRSEEALINYLLALGYYRCGDKEKAEGYFIEANNIRDDYRQCFLGMMIFEMIEQDVAILDKLSKSIGK